MPSPFLDDKSFETQEIAAESEARETFEAPASHFLSAYGYEEGEPVSDPVTEEHAEFLNELCDEEMNEALAGLVAEAANLADSRGLEVSEDDEAQAGSAAVAANIEDTVRRVAALPDHFLDDRPLLQAYAIEAFEAAAASNLRPILPERIYRKRPDLRPGGATRGAWLTLPPGNRRKRFKNFSRVVRAKLTPHKVEIVPGGDAEPLSEFLEDEFALDPGEEFEAQVHLYETLPGAGAVDIARTPREQGGLGSAGAVDELHPLTPHAAALLVAEPALGLESTDGDFTADHDARARHGQGHPPHPASPSPTAANRPARGGAGG
ncbi:MAG: hypothetical protein HS113_06650 [Verrucomicrobiales bacterium]|nr:hypothetical protein [Verrucomicrobiales bacterium]